jgi:hypothetical protein
MKQSRLWLLALACSGLAMLARPAQAQAVGSKLTNVQLEGYAQTAAKSWDDFLGRAVLIEFFAYW